ncbi:NADP oxidoreductase [Rhodococcus sp. ACS1]|uniref:NADPH-dependent F420 reductase n=1 Tax=Rhodococcus sp. ACS1 TaxID=2028570 RepID=UPI000BB13C18|nr:NADP oxidoreductase [Rhodococcus sp. ACS1]
MAGVLGARAVAGGNSVQVLGRDAAMAAALAGALGGSATAGTIGDTPLTGDIVILAVPYADAAPIVRRFGDALTGKVIVDITNPFDPTTPSGLATPADSSAAQEIANAAPAGTHVVKAFNTLFSGVLAAGEVAGRPVDVFLAGGDTDAKNAVSSFVDSIGLRSLDAGDLKFAHWLGGAGLLILG